MNINVGPAARARFWDVPNAGIEYWDFSFVPPCKVGDPLIFRFDGVAVARALVDRINLVEGAGIGGDKWRVYWKRSTFEDLRGASAADRPPDTKRETNRTGGLFGGGGGGRML